MVQELLKIFVHLVIPALAGITFFALAKFVKQVTPLRALVTSPQVYNSAFIAFLIFGFYCSLRTVQVVAGPHPWPLIFSTIREFLLLAIFSPALFIAMLTLCFGSERIGIGWMVTVSLFGLISAGMLCFFNASAIGGSEEIVKLGKLTAYDGLWFKSQTEDIEQKMKMIYWIHIVNPGFLIFAGSILLMLHAFFYPKEKKQIYDNMPKKLLLLGLAFAFYSLVFIAGSFFYGFMRLPDQWPTYSLVCLVAGIIEAFSLALPVRSNIQISEHEQSR